LEEITETSGLDPAQRQLILFALGYIFGHIYQPHDLLAVISQEHTSVVRQLPTL
jgi:hypothetical protein